MSESSNNKPLVLIGLVVVIALVGFGIFKMQSGPEGAAVGWSTIDDARKFSPGLGGFPSPNAVNVPIMWDGNEVPQPAPPLAQPRRARRRRRAQARRVRRRGRPAQDGRLHRLEPQRVWLHPARRRRGRRPLLPRDADPRRFHAASGQITFLGMLRCC